MASVLAIVSKSIFESIKPMPALGKVPPFDGYDSKTKALSVLDQDDALFLVTVRPGEVLWLVAVVRGLTFTGTRWSAAQANSTPVTDISALRSQLEFDSGKGMSQEAGKLGMSLQSPRALTANDVKKLLAAVGEQAPSSPSPAATKPQTVTETPSKPKTVKAATPAKVAPATKAPAPTSPAPAPQAVPKTEVASLSSGAPLPPKHVVPRPAPSSASGPAPMRFPYPPPGRSVVYDLAAAILADPEPSSLASETRDKLLKRLIGPSGGAWNQPRPDRLKALEELATSADEACWDWVLARWLLRGEYEDSFVGHHEQAYFAALVSKAPSTALVRALEPLLTKVQLAAGVAVSVLDLVGLEELKVSDEHWDAATPLDLSRLPALECLAVIVSDPSRKLKWEEVVDLWSERLRALVAGPALHRLKFESYFATSTPALEGSVFDSVELTGRDFVRLTGLSEVRTLRIGYNNSLQSLAELAVCDRLETLRSNLQALRDLDGLQTVPLKTLELESSNALKSLEGLNAATLESLRARRVDSLSSLVALAAARGLRVLEVTGSGKAIEVAPLQTSSLEKVRLADLPKLEQSDFDCLFEGGHSPREVRIVRCPKVTDVAALVSKSTEVLDLRGCKGLRELPELDGCERLRRMNLWGTRFEPSDLPETLRPLSSWAEHPDEELMERNARR